MADYNNENSGKKVGGIIIGVIAILAIGAAALYLIDVDQTQEARLPEVDVAVEEGQVPKFDVDVADVEVGTKEVGVDVPNVDVETKTIEVEVPVDADVNTDEVQMEVPTIDVEKPEEDSPDDDNN